MKKYNITYSNEHNFIWYRTAKCGTRTVLQYIKDNGSSSISRYKMQYQSNWNDYFQFTFVRNPWERLVSVYFSKFGKLKISPIQNKTDLRFFLRERHDFMRQLKFKRVPTFAQFVRQLQKPKMIQRNAHWAPLCSLIRFENLDFIGRMENFEEDLKYITYKSHLKKTTIQHINRCRYKKHYSEFYNENLKNIVSRLYKHDIYHFNYKFEKEFDQK